MIFESKIIEFLQSNLSTFWVTFFQIVTLFGGLLGFLITFLILFTKDRRLSYIFVVTFLCLQILNKILKFIIARERPFVSYSEIINYGNESGYSMPSGHALSVGCYAVFLSFLAIKSSIRRIDKSLIVTFLSILVLSVDLSRMVLGVHYLTDVILGTFIGIIVAIIAIMLYNSHIKNLQARGKDGRDIISDDKQ